MSLRDTLNHLNRAIQQNSPGSQDITQTIAPCFTHRFCGGAEKKGRTRLNGLTEFVAQADVEMAGNAMICAVNQAAYLLRRLVEKQSRDFV